MRKGLSIKKYVIIMIVLIVIFLSLFFSINYVINNNDYYINNIVKEIKNNYKVDKKIESANIYGGYYIVSYKDEIVVLDKEYKEVYKEDKSKLSDNTNNYDIVYKNNKLMYEETTFKKDKLVYNYYDIHSYELVSSITLK